MSLLDEKYSRKILIGNLPPNTTDHELFNLLHQFGGLTINWPPYNAASRNNFCFITFENYKCVMKLLNKCNLMCNRFYLKYNNESLWIRPWNIKNTEHYSVDNISPNMLDVSVSRYSRKMVFLKGVPITLYASTITKMLEDMFGDVEYVKVLTDKADYPNGYAYVLFAEYESCIAAMIKRLIKVNHKSMSVFPYFRGHEICDECQSKRVGVSCFCIDVMCLQYYCKSCTTLIHSRHGWDHHIQLPIINSRYIVDY